MADEKKPTKPSDKDIDMSQPNMSPRDEAPPGTPGTAENIDPKTGKKFIEGVGGA